MNKAIIQPVTLTQQLCAFKFGGATVSLLNRYVLTPQTLVLIPHHVISSQYWPVSEQGKTQESP
jgi:hypothetical protein